MSLLSEFAGSELNSILVNHYPSGKSCLAWHSDDESELGPLPTIVSLSVDAERDFIMLEKKTQKRSIESHYHLAPF
jgi:alkylated DNA repair dioxygenase AlkB